VLTGGHIPEPGGEEEPLALGGRIVDEADPLVSLPGLSLPADGGLPRVGRVVAEGLTPLEAGPVRAVSVGGVTALCFEAPGRVLEAGEEVGDLVERDQVRHAVLLLRRCVGGRGDEAGHEAGQQLTGDPYERLRGFDVPELRQMLWGGLAVALHEDLSGLDDLVESGAVPVLRSGTDEPERHGGSPFWLSDVQNAADRERLLVNCRRLHRAAPGALIASNGRRTGVRRSVGCAGRSDGLEIAVCGAGPCCRLRGRAWSACSHGVDDSVAPLSPVDVLFRIPSGNTVTLVEAVAEGDSMGANSEIPEPP